MYFWRVDIYFLKINLNTIPFKKIKIFPNKTVNMKPLVCVFVSTESVGNCNIERKNKKSQGPSSHNKLY